MYASRIVGSVSVPCLIPGFFFSLSVFSQWFQLVSNLHSVLWCCFACFLQAAIMAYRMEQSPTILRAILTLPIIHQGRRHILKRRWRWDKPSSRTRSTCWSKWQILANLPTWLARHWYTVLLQPRGVAWESGNQITHPLSSRYDVQYFVKLDEKTH